MLKRLRNLVSPPDVPARSTSGTSRLLRDAGPAVEQRAALLAGKNVTYTLKRSSRRRSIGLRVDDRGLTVCVPARTSEKWLHSVLQEKADWVLEKLDGWKSRKPAEMRWEDGERVHYKGELLILRVERSLFAAPPHRHGNELRVFVVNDSTAAHVKQTVLRWYRNEAEQLFGERAAHYAQLLGVVPREIKLSAATTQWGSCSPLGSVRLNVQLIKLPLRLIDYVVVHELAHLREMNHSAAFWSVVASACSEYPRLRKELRAFSLCSD
jgi:predicted metal-dependent hydrolase